MTDKKSWRDAKLTEVTGWRALLLVPAIFWCLGSGMYTLALVIRRLIG